jgi:hypothetical protein
MTLRSFLGGPVSQGADEKIRYWFTTTEWGSSPSAVSVTVTTAGEDVTATVTEGTHAVLDDTITLPLILDLEAGTTYRVEVLFTTGGNTFEAYFEINAET